MTSQNFKKSAFSEIPIIMNSASGLNQTGKRQLIHDAFSQHLHVIKIYEVNGNEIVRTVQKLIHDGHKIIVASGGDGTISTVASQLINSNVTLGLLPMGTMNNFAKTLKIPMELSDAAKVILNHRTHKIDVGEVNGKIFINDSGIGIYPGFVQRRKRHQREGQYKILAYFTAFIDTLQRYPLLKVGLISDKKELIRTTPIVFIGNNKYKLARKFEFATRDRIDEGTLSIFFTKKVNRLELIKLFFSTFFGTIYQEKKFDAFFSDTVTIESEHPKLQVATDGEVASIQTPLHYKIIPQALTVLIP